MTTDIRKRSWALPLLWLGGMLGLTAMGGAGGVLLANLQADDSLHDTWYVVAHAHYLLGAGAVLLAFLAAYALMEWLRAPYRRPLGWTQSLLTLAGFLLLFAPQLILSLNRPRRYVDYEQSFALLNTISLAGYLLIALGAGLFLALLVDLAVRSLLRQRRGS